MNIYALVVFGYLGLLFLASVVKLVKVKGQEEFMVGGRSVSTPLLILTLISTWIGSGSIIAGAGLAYRVGFSELWLSAGAWFAIILVYFLAGRVRNITEYTLPDLLEKRYGPFARLCGTITIILACVTIVGYQFKGCGMVLNLIVGIPLEQGIPMMAAAVILLTAIAGMMSVVSMDLFNGILITVGVLVGVPLIIQAGGGWHQVVQTLPSQKFSVSGGHGPVWILAVFLPTFFLLLGESSMYQKFFSAKSEKAARHAVIGWIIGTVVIETAICAMAVFAGAVFPNLEKTETVILHIARFGLAPWAGCLLLATALAVIVSTANSFLLTPATNVTRDIFQRFISPNASQKTILVVNRLAIVVLGFVAYLLLTQFKTVLAMAFTAYTMIGAGLTPAVLACFFWKRVTKMGGLASILGGMLGTIATKILFDSPLIQDFFLRHYAIADLSDYIILPPLFLSFILLVFVSLVTKPDDKWQIFYA